jgi:phosphatidylethanolamine/phosphatidyl-N-methylethanolamine N-methyltransferase
MKSLYLTFFKEYCRDYRGIGSVVPDSRVCLNNLLKGVPFDSANVILEYGGATGSMTREIIKRKEPTTTFVCFEKNGRFFNRLKDTIQATNFYLVHDDVLRSRQILASELGLTGGKVDCIVSTLPCSCLNFEELIEQSVLPLLSDQGIFIQYMQLISLFKGFRLDRVLKKYFHRIDSKLVFRNLPPVVIYTCRKDGGRMPDPGKIN